MITEPPNTHNLGWEAADFGKRTQKGEKKKNADVPYIGGTPRGK